MNVHSIFLKNQPFSVFQSFVFHFITPHFKRNAYNTNDTNTIITKEYILVAQCWSV